MRVRFTILYCRFMKPIDHEFSSEFSLFISQNAFLLILKLRTKDLLSSTYQGMILFVLWVQICFRILYNRRIKFVSILKTFFGSIMEGKAHRIRIVRSSLISGFLYTLFLNFWFWHINHQVWLTGLKMSKTWLLSSVNEHLFK